MTNKMKVEVWSDVMCPFCFIGKRHYEQAIQQFGDAANIELEWKSFQLDPSVPEDLNGKQSVQEYLAASKGLSAEQAGQMTAGAAQMAKKAGLEIDFNKAVAANTFKAHRVIQKAKSKGLGDAVEEAFFTAHFMEGLDVGNNTTLVNIGKKAGLTEEEVQDALTNDQYAYLANQDMLEARQIGVSGVPFFVFDRKYAVSGAQPVEVFLNTLQKSFAEWRKANPVVQLELSEGPACTPDGVCN